MDAGDGEVQTSPPRHEAQRRERGQQQRSSSCVATRHTRLAEVTTLKYTETERHRSTD